MKKILLGVATLFAAFMLSMTPVYADCVETSVLGGKKCAVFGSGKDERLVENASGTISCSCDDGGGSSVTDILNLVVDILTIGIGILGVIGITIVGIQYLTAGGSEEKTRKAKRRMFEIIIGLVAYALIYAALNWLMLKPNSTSTTNQSGGSTVHTSGSGREHGGGSS